MNYSCNLSNKFTFRSNTTVPIFALRTEASSCGCEEYKDVLVDMDRDQKAKEQIDADNKERKQSCLVYSIQVKRHGRLLTVVGWP